MSGRSPWPAGRNHLPTPAFVSDPHALATESGKATEPAFAELARRLSARLMACTLEDLDKVAGQVLTPSKLVLEAKGVPSIAEASALVIAGRNARLLGTRVATAQATCAIAIGDGR